MVVRDHDIGSESADLCNRRRISPIEYRRSQRQSVGDRFAAKGRGVACDDQQRDVGASVEMRGHSQDVGLKVRRPDQHADHCGASRKKADNANTTKWNTCWSALVASSTPASGAEASASLFDTASAIATNSTSRLGTNGMRPTRT